jgi:CzcA family heavy metal efflux pump
MINKIIALSLKYRLFVVIASLIVTAFGIFTASKLEIDVLPDINRPTVTIMTEAHAMVPEMVERLITIPLERALNGATDVTKVRSSSGTGLSVVYVEFEWGSDIFRNRQIVQERLQLAQASMPQHATPIMAPVSSIMGQIQMIGVKSNTGKTPIQELRLLADNQIRNRLLGISGVANIIILGGDSNELQIVLDADKLRYFNITVQEVEEAIKSTNDTSSGGVINIGAKGPMITVTGLVQNQEEIAKAVVKYDKNRPIFLSDLANIKYGPSEIKIGGAGVDGEPGVVIVIMKQVGADTVGLTKRINLELETIQTNVTNDIQIIPNVFEQSTFINRAINNVKDAVVDGAILVAVILFLFLLNFRTTFITLTAIPLSIALTIVTFSIFDLTINTMTLGGLAIAIGALVDDAIVDMENIFRKLKQNAKLIKPKNSLMVIFQASREVRKAIVIGTLLVIVVYIPLFFLSGLEGKLFRPIGITYVISVGCSLIVSLTVTPVLCYFLLAKSKLIQEEKESFVVKNLKNIVEKLIRFSISHSITVISFLLSTLVVAIVVLLNQGNQFLPAFNEGTIQVNLILPPETSFKTSNEFGQRLEKMLMTVESIEHVGRKTGRGEGDEHAHAVNTTEVIGSFDPKSKRPREEIVDEIRKKLAIEFPGIPTEVDQPLAHLLSHMLSGVKAQVAIKVFGSDLDELRNIGAEINNAVKSIPGVKDLMIEQQVLIDQVSVNPNRLKLAHYGLTVNDITSTIDLALGGEKISQINLGQIMVPIIIRLEEKDRDHLDKIRSLRIKDASGRLIEIGDIAEVSLTKTPNNINRENVSRRLVVQHNVADRSLGEVVADVKIALEPINKKLAPGYMIQVSGQFEAQEEAQNRILILSFFSLAITILILYLHFQSLNLTFQVMMTMPMAFIGAVTYIVLSKQVVSIATLVGLIALAGMATRNSILLISHYLYLMREEKMKFSIEMIVKGGQERMVPVLMTALCSGIALIPIAIAPGEPGKEILYPVATVIIGGLISSSCLDYLVVSALFWTFGKKSAEYVASIPEAKDRAMEAFEVEFENNNNFTKEIV